MKFELGIGPNIRKSPYFEATVADGVQSFSVYNHMYIPANFGQAEVEYQRLIDGVVMWDVAAQRQVEICGPDALKLVQYICARDVSETQIGQGKYVPICNYDGVLINDPVLLRLSDDRFWLSIADSDIGLWAQAIAAERGMKVSITEADVSPLAVQGPKAVTVIAALFGDWVHQLKYFWFKQTQLGDIPLVLARSGWSKQGGYELYLQDGSRGEELWKLVKDAGADLGIVPGAPNDIERLESGLLSYGADARMQINPVNPFEVGLGKLVDLEGKDDFIGKQALMKINAAGVKRRLAGFFVDGNPVAGSSHPLPVSNGGQNVGIITEMVYSPRLKKNIAIGLIAIEAIGQSTLSVIIDATRRRLKTTHLPFV